MQGYRLPHHLKLKQYDKDASIWQVSVYYYDSWIQPFSSIHKVKERKTGISKLTATIRSWYLPTIQLCSGSWKWLNRKGSQAQKIARILGQLYTGFSAFSDVKMKTTRLIVRKIVPNYQINALNRVPLTSWAETKLKMNRSWQKKIEKRIQTFP